MIEDRDEVRDPAVHHAIDVRQFGAVGDGAADDTEAIQRSLRASGNSIFFPRGDYRITRSLHVDLAEHGRAAIRGAGATLVHSGSGPALHIRGSHQGTSDPASVSVTTHEREITPLIDGMDVLGDHPEADGIRLEMNLKSVISRTTLRGCRYGIHAVRRNRDLIIDACHIYNNSIGIYLDDVDLHQINIVGNHISHNAAGGIKVAGGAIRNIQVTGNDIEYNHKEGGSDIWFIAGERAIREGAIVGNTIQALSGSGGVNIRIEGFADKTPDKIGHLSITGNHIANQSDANIFIRHSRGIGIHGNTIKGAARNVVIEDSRAVACSENVFDDNPDYRAHQENISHVGSILLRRAHYCNVQGNILTRPFGGSQERGGAIEAYSGSFLNISGCTIVGPRWRGVWLEDVQDSIVTGCIIAPGEGVDSMLEGIAESGGSERNLITGNRVRPGQGDAIRLVSDTSVEQGNLTE